MSNFDFDFREDQLAIILDGNKYIDKWFNAMLVILPSYKINTLLRVAAFISQCAHESSNFRVLKENLNYNAQGLLKTFPYYFPTMDIAKQYAFQPEKIANKVYANRMGNGNEESGDGWKYRGRGILQITGKSNQQEFADSIETPLSEITNYLETFEGSVQGAAWFWDTRNINVPADNGDTVKVTKLINGGTTGLQARINLYNFTLKVLRK